MEIQPSNAADWNVNRTFVVSDTDFRCRLHFLSAAKVSGADFVQGRGGGSGHIEAWLDWTTYVYWLENLYLRILQYTILYRRGLVGAPGFPPLRLPLFALNLVNCPCSLETRWKDGHFFSSVSHWA